MTKTTNEMDGLLTPQDLAEQYLCYLQCRLCSKWTLMDIQKPNAPCSNCKGTEYDVTSTTSKRSFNPFNKRKVK